MLSVHRTAFRLHLVPLFTAMTAMLSFVAAGAVVLPAIAAPSTAPSSVLLNVRTLENRFFFHTYEQDPLEKRLQRLELLVFGQTKSGDGQLRLKHLNATIAERDRESALKLQQQHAQQASPQTATAEPKNSASKLPGSGQYPAVNALEWRALKKTYADESLDDRLGRLETKLFGQPSSSMSYADRVERLNRTLGMGAVATAPPPSGLRGPAPRTKPQLQQPYYFNYDFSWPPSGNNGDFFGFSDPNQKQISELFRQMNQQMEEMMRMTPGFLPYMQEAPLPSQKRPHSFPVPSGDMNQHPTPMPYNDPNSI